MARQSRRTARGGAVKRAEAGGRRKQKSLKAALAASAKLVDEDLYQVKVSSAELRETAAFDFLVLGMKTQIDGDEVSVLTSQLRIGSTFASTPLDIVENLETVTDLLSAKDVVLDDDLNLADLETLLPGLTVSAFLQVDKWTDSSGRSGAGMVIRPGSVNADAASIVERLTAEFGSEDYRNGGWADDHPNLAAEHAKVIELSTPKSRKTG